METFKRNVANELKRMKVWKEITFEKKESCVFTNSFINEDKSITIIEKKCYDSKNYFTIVYNDEIRQFEVEKPKMVTNYAIAHAIIDIEIKYI